MQRLQTSGFSKYYLLFFGLLWSMISCCILVPIFAGNFADVAKLFGEKPNIVAIASNLAFPVLFGGIFIGVGFFISLAGLRPVIAATRVGTPVVQISNTNLRSGEQFTLSYEQPFKSNVDVKRLAVQLVLREAATYRRGTDTVTVTHDHLVQNFELPGQQFQSGQTLAQNLPWAIPRGAMHSFDANRNKLRWLIKITVEMNGWPTYDEEFALTVIPELA
jgi:hypothetical protein